MINSPAIKTGLIAFMLCLFFTGMSAQAQTPPPEMPIAEDGLVSIQPDTDARIPGSLFFTDAQINAIQNAVLGVMSDLPVVPQDDAGPETPQIAPPRRLIRLAGVIYTNPQNWIVWLNGKRVTPSNLPDEIVSIDVRKSSVRLHWYDKKKNKTISITLRPHQTYDLDTGILLPG